VPRAPQRTVFRRCPQQHQAPVICWTGSTVVGRGTPTCRSNNLYNASLHTPPPGPLPKENTPGPNGESPLLFWAQKVKLAGKTKKRTLSLATYCIIIDNDTL
ncbi:unnamed protein product, partial [Ectocarpus fasciculatus]